ncbi:MAG: tRNA (guanosine(46)-N7)-methyltransferase TrmB [Zavarzinella sp.]
MRHRQRLEIDQLTPVLFETSPETTGRLVWEQLFGNNNPIEIEVGFGKGLFLLNNATQHPEKNYFGIEIVRKYQLLTAARVIHADLQNIRLACGDANCFLRDRIPAHSVSTLHIYFPDPWWKARHRKRRVFTVEFVNHVWQSLLPGGHFHIATDVEEYFRVMQEVMQESSSIYQPIELPALPAGEHEKDFLTNFERKYRKEGRPIYRASYVALVQTV